MTVKPYLFVTVGSTDFDSLIKAVDMLAPTLSISEGAMQIGHGHYTPENLPYFRFAPSLTPYYERASLVIAHGGLATTMEVLKRRIPLISVNNTDRYDDHQGDLLEIMAKEGYLIWCQQLSRLAEAIKTAQTTPPRPYQSPECRIHLLIHKFLADHKRLRERVNS